MSGIRFAHGGSTPIPLRFDPDSWQLIAIREGRFDAEADADALLEAFHDPEARDVGARYVASRIEKRR